MYSKVFIFVIIALVLAYCEQVNSSIVGKKWVYPWKYQNTGDATGDVFKKRSKNSSVKNNVTVSEYRDTWLTRNTYFSGVVPGNGQEIDVNLYTSPSPGTLQHVQLQLEGLLNFDQDLQQGESYVAEIVLYVSAGGSETISIRKLFGDSGPTGNVPLLSSNTNLDYTVNTPNVWTGGPLTNGVENVIAAKHYLVHPGDHVDFHYLSLQDMRVDPLHLNSGEQIRMRVALRGLTAKPGSAGPLPDNNYEGLQIVGTFNWQNKFP